MSVPSLYRRVLGADFDRLPAPIREAHDGVRRMIGQAQVDRGHGPVAALACWVMGFPKAASSVELEVEFAPIENGELWRRRFGDRRFQSTQIEGGGAWAGLIMERFGAITLGLAFAVRADRMDLSLRRWSLLGVPMPMVLAPAGEGAEYVSDGRFAFDVEMGHPLIGRIVRYRGWLEPVPER